MSNIFRKIRKSILNEGPTSAGNKRINKYLPYAIGEILLVMIGILLALQVNNWNENLKMQKKVETSLQNLQNDLNSDIEFLTELDSIYADWHLQAENILKSLRNKTTSQFSDLSEFSVGRGSMNNLSIRSTTFDQMRNTGLLFELENPELVQNIYEYYEFAELEIDKANLDNQEFYRYVSNTSGYEYISTLVRVDDQLI